MILLISESSNLENLGCWPHLREELCIAPWPQRAGLLMHFRPAVPGLAGGSSAPFEAAQCLSANWRPQRTTVGLATEDG